MIEFVLSRVVARFGWGGWLSEGVERVRMVNLDSSGYLRGLENRDSD
jgi:hypothetical protein